MSVYSFSVYEESMREGEKKRRKEKANINNCEQK